MKILFAVALTIAFATFGFAQCVRDDVVISSLRGIVVDTNEKRPVANVLISVKKGRKPIAEVLTDASGNFDLTKLKRGQYELTVSYPNFDRIATRLEITKRKSKPEHLQVTIAPPDLSGTDSCEGTATVVSKQS